MIANSKVNWTIFSSITLSSPCPLFFPLNCYLLCDALDIGIASGALDSTEQERNRPLMTEEEEPEMEKVSNMDEGFDCIRCGWISCCTWILGWLERLERLTVLFVFILFVRNPADSSSVHCFVPLFVFLVYWALVIDIGSHIWVPYCFQFRCFRNSWNYNRVAPSASFPWGDVWIDCNICRFQQILLSKQRTYCDRDEAWSCYDMFFCIL